MHLCGTSVRSPVVQILAAKIRAFPAESCAIGGGGGIGVGSYNIYAKRYR